MFIRKKMSLMMGKKSYNYTAVIFCAFGFLLFFGFFLDFLNKQPAAVVLLR